MLEDDKLKIIKRWLLTDTFFIYTFKQIRFYEDEKLFYHLSSYLDESVKSESNSEAKWKWIKMKIKKSEKDND